MNASNVQSMNLDDPWFDLVQASRKRVEGRLAAGKWLSFQPGCILAISNNSGDKSFSVEIIRVSPYASFKEYLKVEGLEACLPGVETIEEGLRVYEKYYPAGKDEVTGIVTIEMIVLH